MTIEAFHKQITAELGALTAAMTEKGVEKPRVSIEMISGELNAIMLSGIIDGTLVTKSIYDDAPADLFNRARGHIQLNRWTITLSAKVAA